MKRGTDVIVVGGGAIGLTTAWELAQQGVSVRVIDRGRCGREASWAGAGMIIPGNVSRAKTPESRLRAHSFEAWPEISRKLLDQTGINNEFRSCGGLEVRFEPDSTEIKSEVEQWRAEGIEVEPLVGRDLVLAESLVSTELACGYQLPAMSQVRNPRHLRALQMACESLGVQFVEEDAVVGFHRNGSQMMSVQTEKATFAADQICVCAGAWTRQLLDGTGFEFDVQPVRGQIVMLKSNPLPFRHIIQIGPRYIVPRSDGRALIGSTEEHVGFEKRTTAAGVNGLLQFAISVVPALAEAAVERTWSGLRPGSPRGIPFIGNVEGTDNLFVAAGHFRCGLQNSPGTGRLLRELMLGQPTTLIPSDFDAHVHTASFVAS
ncbi:MAG: glycine oxidase ThiO [Planctomycetaceae bacterium]